MPEVAVLPALVAEKLAAIDRLEPAFVASFQYVQDVQGQKRFAQFPISSTVEYLHALAVCDAKDRLLGVPLAVDRYEGRRCLELLRSWQAGESADVVAFLHDKLDALPFADLTRQVEAVRADPRRRAWAARLEYGRLVLLNRGITFILALEALFALTQEELTQQVRTACERFGRTPAQLDEQLREMAGPLYTLVRHPALARRNMQLMDRVGVRMTADPTDEPMERTWRVALSTWPAQPFAEQVISGYVALTAPQHNNPAGVRFGDRPATLSAVALDTEGPRSEP